MKKFVSLFLVTALVSITASNTLASDAVKKASVVTPMPKAPGPKIYAQRAIVVDNVTGNVLYDLYPYR